MELLHRINIIIHITFGTIALVIGCLLLLLKKGNIRHIRLGRVYVKIIAVVIVTGLLGVIVFKRNIFLLIVTILSGYTAWSGVRTLQLRGRNLKMIDYAVPLVSMITAIAYMIYMQHAGLFWAPVVTISIMSALFLVTLYDLLRVVMPHQLRKKLVLYEHIYKMTSSFIAITSAFTGTVLGNYKPYSQILPGVLGWVYITSAIVFYALRNKKGISAFSQQAGTTSLTGNHT